MVTDKGPQLQWQYEIGKVEDPRCVCDDWTPQNAVHLKQCPWGGGGRGRITEQTLEDEKWCESVAGFIS